MNSALLTYRNPSAFRRHAPRLARWLSSAFVCAHCLTACGSTTAPEAASQQPDDGTRPDSSGAATDPSAALSAGTDATSSATNGDARSDASDARSTDVSPTTLGPGSSATSSDSIGAATASSSDASHGEESTRDAGSADPTMVGSCETPISVTCGARLHHDTELNGQPNQMGGYACSARAESGPETIYRLDDAENCAVVVRLTAEADLDLFRLSECKPLTGDLCSSTPWDIDVTEQLHFVGGESGTSLIVVDGYADASGAYTLEVDCECNGGSDGGAL